MSRFIQNSKAVIKNAIKKNGLGKKIIASLADGQGVGLTGQRNDPRATFEALNRTRLEIFLATGATLELPCHHSPELSVIIVLDHAPELTLSCLQHLLRHKLDATEIIFAGHALTDEAKRLLSRFNGARIIEDKTAGDANLSKVINQSAEAASGKHLLFLHNNTQISAESITAALKSIESATGIGAVGGKIIHPHGALQEAGSMIWRDGSYIGYGSGHHPFMPEYCFKRKVDCCAQAFLLTKRDLFIKAGGFDESYQAAYFADYCLKLWETGSQVIYDPNIIVVNLQITGQDCAETLPTLPSAEQANLVEKHRHWLSSQPLAAECNLLSARSLRDERKRILFIDDRVPHPHFGAGDPRSHLILSNIIDLGYFVTFYPITNPYEEWASVYQDIPQEVEVMIGYGPGKLEQFLRERKGYYDLFFVSRPTNMELLKAIAQSSEDVSLDDMKIIYDAEALFSMRKIELLRLRGEPLSQEQAQELITEEMGLAENVNCIISVSEPESLRFTEYGYQKVYTLGHALTVPPTPNTFDARQDMLFVGPVHLPETPNADAVNWFSKEIFPIIQESLGSEVKVFIAGANCLERIGHLANESIIFTGRVDDLTPLYNHAKFFVNPTRFGAGIALKVYEAAAHGLPVIATSLIAAQLGWQHERELLVADDAEGFADGCVRLYRDAGLWSELRANGLKRVRAECSIDGFSAKLKCIIEEAFAPPGAA